MGLGKGERSFLFLFYFMKSQCTKEEEAPKSIIAEVEIFESPWNMRGIFRCCLFAPKIIVDNVDERENDKEEMIEEKQLERN
jgi:hypothetical protein